MIIDSLKELFTRDLNRLKKEIESYKDEKSMWTIENSIKNSGGNLCLHLAGNLKTFIGNSFADYGYIRKRDFEFGGKFVPREKLLQEVDEAIAIVNKGLSNITEEQLEGNFPVVIWAEPTGMVFTLLHLHSHLNYHLGQVNYHRRIIDKG